MACAGALLPIILVSSDTLFRSATMSDTVLSSTSSDLLGCILFSPVCTPTSNILKERVMLLPAALRVEMLPIGVHHVHVLSAHIEQS